MDHSTMQHLGLGDISCSMLNLFVGDSFASRSGVKWTCEIKRQEFHSPLALIYLVRRRSIFFFCGIGPRCAVLPRWTKDGQKDAMHPSGCRKLG